MKKVFSLFFFSVLGLFLFMGQKSINKPEKWNIDPQQTGIYDPNVISTAPLPQEYDYFNPNNTTRYISSPCGTFIGAGKKAYLPSTAVARYRIPSKKIIARYPAWLMKKINITVAKGKHNSVAYKNARLTLCNRNLEGDRA